MIANKLDSYAQNCTDPQLKSMLQKDGQDARQAEQQLLGFLDKEELRCYKKKIWLMITWQG